MIHHYYTIEKLLTLEDHSLSFGIANNILDNALQFVEHPFELFREDNWGYKNKHIEEYDLIAAFLSVATAIELLMKAKIALKGWQLIANSSRRTTRENLIRGEFNSIAFEKCVGIIEREYGIVLDSRIKSRLNKIRTTRNKITHYFQSISKKEIIDLIAFGLDIFVDFYRRYLREDVYHETDMTEYREKELATFSKFVELRIESNRHNEGPVIEIDEDLNDECSKCYTISLVITQNHEIKCMYCEAIFDIEEYARDWADPDTEPGWCDACEKKTVISRHSTRRCIICKKRGSSGRR